jgi:tetratricopeptide (TPR) repeat protein
MARSPPRRRIARLVLAGLVLVHLAAFAAYGLRAGQLRHQQLFLDARDQWRAGNLPVAASGYGQFVRDYARVTWPVILTPGFPSEASGWFALGRIEAERGEIDSALAAFERAMRLEPGLGRREYRDLLLESGRAAQLAVFARRELAQDAHSLAANFDLGAALLATGRPEEAARVYEHGLTLVPGFLATRDPTWRGEVSAQEAQLLNLASVAHLAAGDRVQAAAMCDGLSARTPPGVRLDQLCRAYLSEAAGEQAASLEALKGYTPPAPEQEALVASLKARLAR